MFCIIFVLSNFWHLSAEVSLEISWKSNEKLLKQNLSKTLKNCLNYEQTLIIIYLFFIRLIQEEKQTTEQRAEELESRVGSVEHMNLLLQQSVGGPASGSGSGSGYNNAGGGGGGSGSERNYRSNNTTPLPPSSSSVPPPLPPSRDGNNNIFFLNYE